MRFSANTGFLWKDLPFLDRIDAAARAGFEAVDFHDEWGHEALDDIAAALRDAELPAIGLNTRMDDTAGCAAIPGEEARAREDAEAAIDMARSLGAAGVHVTAGKVSATPEALTIYRANLSHAYAKAGDTGLVILIEPLCTKAVRDYPLRTVEQAAEIIQALGHSNLRIMFDIFHVHQEGHDILSTCERYRDVVGHIQIVDPETRREPSAHGFIAIAPLLEGLRQAGYRGPFGCEYNSATDVEKGLAWREGLKSPSA